MKNSFNWRKDYCCKWQIPLTFYLTVLLYNIYICKSNRYRISMINQQSKIHSQIYIIGVKLKSDQGQCENLNKTVCKLESYLKKKTVGVCVLAVHPPVGCKQLYL